jgi:hypothetical protein
MFKIEGSETGWAIAAPRLRLRFLQNGERWVHHIDIRRESEWIEVARSFESGPGSDATERVPSPTYQQILVTGSPDEPLVLLLGQHGPHHFSAVFRIREEPHRSYIEVDVADRCRQTIAAPACSYLVTLLVGLLADGSGGWMEWNLDDRKETTLRFQAGRNMDLSACPGGRSALLLQAVTRDDLEHSTRRLTYSWVLADQTRDKPK